jgi:hypothetical protein
MLRGRHHGVLTRGGGFATRGPFACKGRRHPGVRVWLPGAVAARRRLLPGGDPRDSLPGDEELAAKGKNPHAKKKKGNGKPGGPPPPPFLTRGRPVPPAPPPSPPGERGTVPCPPLGPGAVARSPQGGPRGKGARVPPAPPGRPCPQNVPREPPRRFIVSYVRVPLCRPSVSAEETPRAPALLRDARPPFARPFAGGGSGAGNRSRASRGARPSACPRRGDLLPRGAAPAKPPAMCLPPRGVSSPGRRAPRGGTPARIMCVPGDATVWTWKFPGRLPGLCPRIPGAPGRSRAGSVALGAPSPDETPSPRVGLTRG